MKVIFRVDSGTGIGSGHLMRCLALAEGLRDQDVQVSFVSRELPGNLIPLLLSKEMPVSVLPAPAATTVNPGKNNPNNLGVTQAEDALQTIEALNGKKADWLVVDHYGLGVEWEENLSLYCKSLMVIDDLANRSHACDILLDQNYFPDNMQRYKALVPPLCKKLLGPKYALLQKEFQKLRKEQAGKIRDFKKLLVFFTAGDDQGETLKAMHGIALFGKAEHVDVVVGKANTDRERIREMCLTQNWGYHCQVDYMPALIAQADLVIGGGGSSNWERCALGMPALVVILAENQAAIAQALDSAGVAINLGWNTNVQAANYATALKAMTTQRLATLSKEAFKLVDAEGTQRIVEILLVEQSIQLAQARCASSW
jgi:UDP-2,4-diacetamido-2,4,6-trideoxy-beta-L-altropyranose hydrolase